jgi:hypothetical protein
MAANVMDHAGILKTPRRNRDSFATAAQHIRNELLGHLKLVGLHPVVA